MTTTILTRKCEMPKSFTFRTEEKLEKLAKFFDTEATARVTVTEEKLGKRVEITVRSNGLLYRAEESAPTAEEAVDTLVDVLVRQIRRNKTKLEKRLRAGAVDMMTAEGDEEEDTYDVVRSKSFPVKPMSVEEAILQMNMLGHMFYMFRDMHDEEIRVVYRRRDGRYGLLVPEAE